MMSRVGFEEVERAWRLVCVFTVFGFVFKDVLDCR